MSTTAIVILVAIGLVIMMQLNGRARDQEDAPDRQGFITRWLHSRYWGCPGFYCSFSSGVPRLFLATSWLAHTDDCHRHAAECERLSDRQRP